MATLEGDKGVVSTFAAWGVDDSVYMLVDLEETGHSGPTLLEMDRTTGEILARIPSPKRPMVAFDSAHHRVFMAKDHASSATRAE